MSDKDKDYSPLNISKQNNSWNKMALEISREIRSVPRGDSKARPVVRDGKGSVSGTSSDKKS